MKKYGYVRVSTREQNLERQVLAMKEEGIEEKIYMQIRCQEKILTDLNITGY